MLATSAAIANCFSAADASLADAATSLFERTSLPFSLITRPTLFISALSSLFSSPVLTITFLKESIKALFVSIVRISASLKPIIVSTSPLTASEKAVVSPAASLPPTADRPSTTSFANAIRSAFNRKSRYPFR